jgi:hypothetical protein
MACEPPAGRPTWSLGQGCWPHLAGQEGQLSGAGPWDPPLTGKGASHTSGHSGGPFGSHLRRSQGQESSLRSSREANRVFTAWLFHCTGRTRLSPEELTMATSELSWPAWSSLPILRPRQARPALESKGLTSPRVARRGEATWKRRAIRRPAFSWNQKPLVRGVTSRNKTRTAPELPGQLPAIYGRKFPGSSSVVRLLNSFLL